MESSTVIITKGDCWEEEQFSNQPLVVYCLPVSGGAFTGQCGLLSELYEARKIQHNRKFEGIKNYQPDLVLAASGGNAAAYIAMAGDWSPEGILRVARMVNPSIFARPWVNSHVPFIIPSLLVGIMNGSIFRSGSGAVDLFECIYTPLSIQRTEIWTGTYDHTHRRAQFFCNLSRGNSIIQPDYFDDFSFFFGCMPLKYLGGDIPKIAMASMASASIPVVVPKQEIDGTFYADGGAMYASPISVMAPELYRIIMGQSSAINGEIISGGNKSEIKIKTEKYDSEIIGHRSLRLVYFCAYEMDVPRGKNPPSGSLGHFSVALAQLIHSNALQDRSNAIDLLHRICGHDSKNIVSTHHARLNKNSLSEVLTHLDEQQHYVLILYPHGCPSVPIHRFTKNDIEKTIKETRGKYGAFCWYLPY